MTAATLPSTGAMTGLKETWISSTIRGSPNAALTPTAMCLGKLLAQRIVFIRGERAITDLLKQSEALEGWWPESVRQLLGSRSLANRSGEGQRHDGVVGQLFPVPPSAVTPHPSRRWWTSCERTCSPPQHRFPWLHGCAASRWVIATTVLGLEADSRDVLFADFEIWTQALFSIPMAIPGTPFLGDGGTSRLLEQLTDVLQSHQPRSGGLDLLSGGLDEVASPSTTRIWPNNCCCCCLPATRRRRHP